MTTALDCTVLVQVYLSLFTTARPIQHTLISQVDALPHYGCGYDDPLPLNIKLALHVAIIVATINFYAV